MRKFIVFISPISGYLLFGFSCFALAADHNTENRLPVCRVTGCGDLCSAYDINMLCSTEQNYASRCYKEAICERKNGKKKGKQKGSTPGECAWTKDKYYKSCKKDHDKLLASKLVGLSKAEQQMIKKSIERREREKERLQARLSRESVQNLESTYSNDDNQESQARKKSQRKKSLDKKSESTKSDETGEGKTKEKPETAPVKQWSLF